MEKINEERSSTDCTRVKQVPLGTWQVETKIRGIKTRRLIGWYTVGCCNKEDVDINHPFHFATMNATLPKNSTHSEPTSKNNCQKQMTDEWVADGRVCVTRNMEGVMKQMIIQANP